jgi:hypothetical protein
MNSTFTIPTYVCLSTSYICVSVNSPHTHMYVYWETVLGYYLIGKMSLILFFALYIPWVTLQISTMTSHINIIEHRKEPNDDMNSTFTIPTYVCLSTSYICVSVNSPHTHSMCVRPLPTYGCLFTRYIYVSVRSPHMYVCPFATWC